MNDRYVLDDNGTPTPCDDLMAWARWFEHHDRLVARTNVLDIVISTVFLGLDHSFGCGPPQLYETLVSGGEHDGMMRRYATREDAQAGHIEIERLHDRSQP